MRAQSDLDEADPSLGQGEEPPDRWLDPLPARPGPSVRVQVSEWRDGAVVRREDRLATEEPLEIRLAWPGRAAERFVVTMRTPGHDFELAAGLVAAEGLLPPVDVIDAARLETGNGLRRVAYCTDEQLSPEEQFNVVTVTLDEPPLHPPGRRQVSVSAACGVCGKESIDELTAWGAAPIEADLRLAPSIVRQLPDRLREAQRVFARTGGLHGAALFDADGHRSVTREDIGRHNAVDKVVGHRLLQGGAGPASVLCVSGRVGFEIVQKAVMARLPLIVAVGAPSSLAVDLAQRYGVTLIGWVRDDRLVCFSHPQRIGVAEPGSVDR